MSNTRAPNHPVNISGCFETLDASVPESLRTNQYSNVSTPSCVQCGAPNNGSTPVLTYQQTSLVQITAAGPTAPDFTNKATVVGLGLVVKREEVVSAADDGLSNLHVTIQHSDWDSVHRSHKTFTVLYVVPGTKIFAKTHGLYVVGREVEVTGQLVDFDMERYSAIVSVSFQSPSIRILVAHLSPSVQLRLCYHRSSDRTPFIYSYSLSQWEQERSHVQNLFTEQAKTRAFSALCHPAKDTFANNISDTEMTSVDLPSSERNGKGKESPNPGGNDSDSLIVNRSSSPSSKVRPQTSVLQAAAKQPKTS
ncbi:hypothetical protein PSHT_06281 [Puccinia striiformis]|uniref:Uncharacterized protein n=1 Tax=Puccinia striiformis TaxID=27350 RepID=A0A2S4W7Q2_9BASI|nr:hypothetical protein PSHT_06281 [Puccinia striiformis]